MTALALPEPTFKPLRVYSDGAGTQSIATMVLQAQGKLPKPYDQFVFANVGDDSENPDTLAYRKEYIIPFAEKHGLNLVERQRIYKGSPITLLQFLKMQDRTIAIPMYFSEGGKGTRKCTVDHKIYVVQKHIKSLKPTHVELGIGFSAEEGGRVYQKYKGWHDRTWSRDKKKSGVWKPGAKLGYWQLYEFPLAQLRLRKADCIALVKEAGLPEPPPSLCWFCPFTKRSVWRIRKVTRHPFYDMGVELEEFLNAKYQGFRVSPKKSKRIGLYPDRIPLADIGDQAGLWDEIYDDDVLGDAACEIGVCGV